MKDADVGKYLSEAEIAENFDLGYHLKHVDTIFQRVFGEQLHAHPKVGEMGSM